MDGPSEITFAAQRRAMVEEQLRRRGIRDERVLAAMGEVPREQFVGPQRAGEAYSDRPVPIGREQSTSQPYMIAAMLQAAMIGPTDRVLEIGAGSGYQTAVLAKIAAHVYAVERHDQLTRSAGQALERLHIDNVTLVTGDGTLGLPQFAPYNAIIVSAAAPRVPPALIAQLAEGGRLAVPVGSGEDQFLQVVRKEKGGTSVVTLEGCRFVPLIGEQGFVG